VKEIFLLPQNFHASSGAYPASRSIGAGARGAKSKITRKWSYTSVPLYALVAWTVTILYVFINKCMKVQVQLHFHY